MKSVSMKNVEVGLAINPVERTIDQDMINAWAEVSGDHNPLHVDPEYARTTRFGGTIAHGHIALGWLCEMMLSWAGGAWLRGGALKQVRFVAPIRPGYTIRAEGTVTDIIVEDGTRQAVCDIRIVNTANDEVCVVGSAVVPLPRQAGK